MSDIAEQPCPACGRVPWDIIEWKARAGLIEAERDRLREALEEAERALAVFRTAFEQRGEAIFGREGD